MNNFTAYNITTTSRIKNAILKNCRLEKLIINKWMRKKKYNIQHAQIFTRFYACTFLKLRWQITIRIRNASCCFCFPFESISIGVYSFHPAHYNRRKIVYMHQTTKLLNRFDWLITIVTQNRVWDWCLWLLLCDHWLTFNFIRKSMRYVCVCATSDPYNIPDRMRERVDWNVCATHKSTLAYMHSNGCDSNEENEAIKVAMMKWAWHANHDR